MTTKLVDRGLAEVASATDEIVAFAADPVGAGGEDPVRATRALALTPLRLIGEQS